MRTVLLTGVLALGACGRSTEPVLAPMATPRHGVGAAVVGDRIFVPGGATVQGFGASGVTEVFEVPSGRSCS